MIKIELTDDEVTTILVALDNYSSMKDTDWVDSGCEDDELRAESSSADWCFQKLFGAQQQFRNSIADAVGEGEQTKVDPFDFRGLEF
jgi:hypothetical protein